MNIAICIKQVPDLESLEFDPLTKTIRREGVVNLVNTFEKHALTAAKELVEASGGGEVTVITMGPPQAKEALLEMLASGADRAVHLNDRAFAGSDTLATSRALAQALARGQYDLVFCGKYSLDAETGQVGPEVAELLGIPQVTNAVKVAQLADGRLAVTRMTDDGSEELLVELPALLTVPEDIAHPARPNRAGREAAASKPYEVISAADLALDAELLGVKGSPTSVREISTIEVGRRVRQIPAGNLRAAAQELAGVLVDLGVFGRWKLSGGEVPMAPDSRAPSSDRAVWVVAELYDGRVRPVTFELLGKAVALAEELDSEVCAVALGPESASVAPELSAHGADRVLLATGAELEHYDTRRYAHVLAEAIRARQPYVVLLPSTVNGRDLAPRVAAQLGLGLTGDCIGFELDAEQHLVQLKPAFGGNIVAPILSSTRPQMATARPGVLQARRPNPTRQPLVEVLSLAGLPSAGTQWLSAAATVGAKGVELESARMVVGVGYGLGGPQNLPLAEDLAATLRASVAVTRKIVDLGWVPRQQQVGLTGKVISPLLYVAVGIRGFFNHTIGIQKAQVIVSINRDPEAPIFAISDYGVVADALEFLPLLTAELAAARRSTLS